MFKTIKNAWSIPDLRKKILFTLLIIVVFRFGATIPVPFLDVDALQGLMGTVNETGNALSYLDMLSGGAFANATMFAMGISPYINSSIIMQLLTVAIPPLERMAKEGEEGRKRIATITRYVTVALGLIQGTAYYFYLRNSTYQGAPIALYTSGWEQVFAAIVIILAFTAGTAIMMWMGEQINQKGIGNGISILLFAGIVARMPHTIRLLTQYISAAIADPSNYGPVPGCDLGNRFHERFRAPHPGSVCKACGWPEDVRRPEHAYPDQGCDVRRYADHLRKLDPLHSEHNPALHGHQCVGLLAVLL